MLLVLKLNNGIIPEVDYYTCNLLELFLFSMLNLVKLLYTFISYLFSLFSEQQNLLLNMCCL